MRFGGESPAHNPAIGTLDRATPGQLLDAIRHFEAIPVGDGVYRLIRPTTLDVIDHATGTSLDQTGPTLTELRTWRRDLTCAAKTATFTTPTNP